MGDDDAAGHRGDDPAVPTDDGPSPEERDVTPPAGEIVADREAAETAIEEDEVPNPAAGVLDTTEHRPGVPKPDSILVADDIVRSFGGLRAVDVEHVEFQRGAITALIGPNGAGKTTFFNLLTAFDQPDSGTRRLDGERIDGKPPHVLARNGMVRTFQLTKSLARLNVLENMKLGAGHQTGESMLKAFVRPLWSKQEAEIEAKAVDILEQFRMIHMRDELAGSLSGGQRKLLEMARAMMADPKIIMLDEPMAGVNPALTQSLLHHIKRMRANGITVLFVEHDMDVVRDISDWVVVMAEGQVIAEGPPETIGRNQAVVDAYLGTQSAALVREGE
ncbi:MAG: ABC transporter ATP-binding protein [Acidimicrobiales bacterium]